MSVEAPTPNMELVCSTCGQINIWASPGRSRKPPSARGFWDHQQHRRRLLLFTAVLMVSLLGLMSLILLHPSSASSPARSLKRVVVGDRVAAAAEQLGRNLANAQGHSSSNGDGQNNGTQGGNQTGGGSNSAPGQSQGQGSTGDGSDSGDGTTAGQGTGGGRSRGGTAGGNGSGDGDTGADNGGDNTVMGTGTGAGGGRNRTQYRGGNDSPANVQLPANAPAGPEAPEARSIGFLDRFFGTDRPDNDAIRPGAGGTGDNRRGAGNTNLSTVATTNPITAAQFTQSNVSLVATNDLTAPPSPPALTNRPASQQVASLDDNFERLLREHNAGSGDVRISLTWNNINDLDLHVIDPSGEEINYNHRASASGGLLDIDMNASPPYRRPAVENVFWPDRAAPPGVYQVYVNHFRTHGGVSDTPFTVRILIRGQTTDFPGRIRFGEPKKLIHRFTLAGSDPRGRN
jgi:hypothetical protein